MFTTFYQLNVGILLELFSSNLNYNNFTADLKPCNFQFNIKFFILLYKSL